MKTAMQELVEEMEQSPLMFAPALALIKEKNFLEKEKEQMVDWYATGQADTVNMYEQHLKKTFNPNEK